jgi:hypothetical protein
VIATLAECPALDEDSAIDCNYGFVDQEYMLTRADSFGVCDGGVASAELLNQIRTGILKSESVDPVAQHIVKNDADAIAQKACMDNA